MVDVLLSNYSSESGIANDGESAQQHVLFCLHLYTNFNQDGTILDEFNFRYEIHGKYDSTDIKISTFINDISKRCIYALMSSR